ncbi:hypothetical protein Vadar_018859 [Vaccinium darrowii]|uniref:Uncharacterized protein n=1 Tax=Vaccinium darrowii TaxID=229202 RepID=A0ACB7XII2_9ERIC|nr:hypothetical protein Vadar_018859 [Vaccinium darrowii]
MPIEPDVFVWGALLDGRQFHGNAEAGPRVCLGKSVYRQMKIFSAVLISSFIFKLSDKQKAVNYKVMLTLHIDGGLHVRASRRLRCRAGHSLTFVSGGDAL